MEDGNERLRVFAEILTDLAYDQDPDSGHFEWSLERTLAEHGMSKDALDALAKEFGFTWRCQPPEPDPEQLCKACGGLLWGSLRELCECAEGAKRHRGAELRYKSRIGQCFRPGCEERAGVDGWCDNHSVQFLRYGTHNPVGSQGSRG